MLNASAELCGPDPDTPAIPGYENYTEYMEELKARIKTREKAEAKERERKFAREAKERAAREADKAQPGQ
jgi:hypothetical protein